MSLELTLYIIDFLKSISNLLSWIIGAFTIFMLVLGLFIFIGIAVGELDTDELKKYIKYVIFIPLVIIGLGIINSFIPDKKTMYMITGIHISKEAVQTEIGQKAYKVLDKKLDEYLKEEVK